MKLIHARNARTPVRLIVVNRTRGQILVADGEVADGVIGRMRGLIGHPPLQPGQGLLIKPCSGIHTFGMGYPIDALFVDRHGKVLRTATAISPNRVGPIAPAAEAVIELPAGVVTATGTRISDQLIIRT